MKQPLTSARPQPALNEEAFQQLLEAAYVIQQQNDTLQRGSQKADTNRILSRIIETQRAIHAGHLDLDHTTQLIVDELRDLTSASWAAVGLIEGDELRYRGISGKSGSTLQSSPVDACVSAPCLRTGEVLRYSELAVNGRGPSALPQASGIRSLIAVPVFAEGVVAGVLELGFAQVNAFDERDVSTCQLMAGLITEAMSRAAEFEWKQTLAAERATMLETLERLKPQLERLAEPIQPVADAAPEVESKPAEASKEEIQKPVIAEILCRGCGNSIAEEEAFCGLCGLPSPNQKPTGDIQSKWASLWRMQQAAVAQKKDIALPDPDMAELRDEVSRVLNMAATPAIQASEPDPPKPISSLRILPEETAAAPPLQWGSAALTKKWLESLIPQGKKGTWLAAQWRRQRANVYLGASALLLIAVLAGWNSGDSPAAAPKKLGPPKLSLMERALIALNLAEPPPAPVYLGNPNTQVWVDLHTALYYCPGEDLFGKTEDGKMTTQRDAQQDQFQPALRKVCN